ncbi:LysR family transcriptional regulator [Bdellovibrio reynosensis]|uniref:LysR family transcriptional regulator n=1 Tax=Bdellovibrio reynosensis TaxID=2835041 RepID=A0ABY4C6R7_9BACT|nr:LysR family transcriptional regulator [Bdellovibrio reynosensis]UOF00600.1 LysR family transcriptional regulator [Bdellovibrio reynosensis]
MSLLSPSLEAFWAVVKAGTVLEAATLVNLTQTGVTQRIRSLEKQLGVTLFTRSRKGMRLTAEGEALLRYVQAASDLEGETLSNLSGKSATAVTEVCISGPTSILRSRLVEETGSVLKKYPQLRLRFDFSEDGDVLGKLKSGFAHIGILPKADLVKELSSKPLNSERYLLYGSTRWKKRKFEDILENESIIDLKPESSLTFDLLKKNRVSKFSKHRHFANHLDSIVTLAEQEAGYCALSEEFAKPYVKSGSLFCLNHSVCLERPMVMAWYGRSAMAPYFKNLIDVLSKK